MSDDLICNRCGATWHQRFDRLPKTCARCRSPYWNKERVRNVPPVLSYMERRHYDRRSAN